MFQKFLLICVIAFANSELTFKNVMITCDVDNPLEEEIPFGTIITTNRLEPHLPNDQKCNTISVQYATIPILYPDSLSDINNADFLLLENDNIEEIEPGAFSNSKLKKGLSLKSNKLKEIRRGVFNNVEVPVLILSYNIISYIDYLAFDNMTLLESVLLDHNKLTRIDTFWFRNTPKLNKINLEYNSIQEIPANAFQNSARKESSGLRIDLSHNLIQRVNNRAFENTKKLYFLSLAFNRIQNLDRNLLKGLKTNILVLTNNRLRCLNSKILESHTMTLIDNNPWDCRCLEEMKTAAAGSIVGEEAFRRCNISPNM